ncbi:RNA polymerase sigma factor, sigma-70 family [bacterium A37T11]|nr:RNA polymerase sigma factor, sigma-70 family [bacterium A37T11]
MQLWERREEVHIDNPPADLSTVARYSVYRSMEQQERYVPVDELLESLKSAQDQADARLLARGFYLAIEALPSEMSAAQRTIFRMCYLDDLSPDEIAEQLQLSPNTVLNQLGRALTGFKSLYLLLLLMTDYWLQL